MNQKVIGNVFYQSQWLKNHEVVFENGLITEIKPTNQQAEEGYIIPGGVDLQIYGANKNLVSENPSPERIFQMEDDLLKQGTTGFLLCLATNTLDVFRQAIESIKACGRELRNCMGLHLEGPYLNPKKRGAHIENLIRKATLDELKNLIDVGEGYIKMMTIAPECQDDEVIDFLLSRDVIVSIGHSEATFSQAQAAYNRGVQSTTHLFNAMSPLQHRAPGIPAAVMNHPNARASIIPDGIHVDFEVIKLAKKLMGNRLFMITDAVAECTSGPYQHQHQLDHFVTTDGTLSGSAITLIEGVKNCVQYCDISLEDAIEMATQIPAQLLKNNKIGTIEVGNKAHVLQLDKDLNLKKVYFDGCLVE